MFASHQSPGSNLFFLFFFWVVGSIAFVCVGALAILDALEEEVDLDSLAWWLSERQVPCGGMNGRPEKLEDVRTPCLI